MTTCSGRGRRAGALMLAGALATAGCIPQATTEAHPQPTAGFEQRLKNYVTLLREVEATLPKLPKDATPEQIDTNQRALSELIRNARKGAKQGEFFDHRMQRLVRNALLPIFTGPEGKALTASIMDENPGLSKLAVNTRYPDDVPLSTMPTEVLSALPALEADMEYRFVGNFFILFDSHAHLIVDFMDDVLPD